MYNIPVLKALNKGQKNSEINQKKKKKGKWKKKKSQGICCLWYARHSADFTTEHSKQFSNNTQLFTIENTLSTLRPGSGMNTATCIHSKLGGTDMNDERQLGYTGHLS